MVQKTTQTRSSNPQRRLWAMAYLVIFAILGSGPAVANHVLLPDGSPIALQQSGQAAFATLQEAIDHLIDDPTTDWQSVNVEALRLHLRDMNAVMMEVDVTDVVAIENGLSVLVQPRTPLAGAALSRMLTAHPAALAMETGWVMRVVREKRGYRVRTTGQNAVDADKIRGLSYAGWMAMGNHHPLHHWGIITGQNPHESHH
jgi:hypothetical protein